MALTATYTASNAGDTAVPLSITNPAAYGASTLTLTISNSVSPSPALTLWAPATNGIVPVYNHTTGQMVLVSDALTLNTILAKLYFNRNDSTALNPAFTVSVKRENGSIVESGTLTIDTTLNSYINTAIRPSFIGGNAGSVDAADQTYRLPVPAVLESSVNMLHLLIQPYSWAYSGIYLLSDQTLTSNATHVFKYQGTTIGSYNGDSIVGLVSAINAGTATHNFAAVSCGGGLIRINYFSGSNLIDVPPLASNYSYTRNDVAGMVRGPTNLIQYPDTLATFQSLTVDGGRGRQTDPGFWSIYTSKAGIGTLASVLEASASASSTVGGARMSGAFRLRLHDGFRASLPYTLSVLASSGPLSLVSNTSSVTGDMSGVASLTISGGNGQSLTATATVTSANLVLSSMGGGVWNASTKQLSYSGGRAAMNTFLQNIGVVGSNASSVTDNMTVAVSDGTTNVSRVIPINLVDVQKAPIWNGIAANYSYARGTNAFNFTGISVNDTDYQDTFGLTITLSQAYGVLSSSAAGGVWNSGAGTFTANGNITTINNILAGLRFTPAADTIYPDFTISFAVVDHDHATVTSTTTMKCTGVAPVLTGMAATYNWSTNTGSFAITGLAVQDSEVGDIFSFELSAPTMPTTNPAAGSFVATGAGWTPSDKKLVATGKSLSELNTMLGTLMWSPGPSAVIDFDFTIKITDAGGRVATGTSKMHCLTNGGGNDAPTLTAPASVTYDPATIGSGAAVFGGMTAADANGGVGYTLRAVINDTNSIFTSANGGTLSSDSRTIDFGGSSTSISQINTFLSTLKVTITNSPSTAPFAGSGKYAAVDTVYGFNTQTSGVDDWTFNIPAPDKASSVSFTVRDTEQNTAQATVSLVSPNGSGSGGTSVVYVRYPSNGATMVFPTTAGITKTNSSTALYADGSERTSSFDFFPYLGSYAVCKLEGAPSDLTAYLKTMTFSAKTPVRGVVPIGFRLGDSSWFTTGFSPTSAINTNYSPSGAVYGHNSTNQQAGSATAWGGSSNRTYYTYMPDSANNNNNTSPNNVLYPFVLNPYITSGNNPNLIGVSNYTPAAMTAEIRLDTPYAVYSGDTLITTVNDATQWYSVGAVPSYGGFGYNTSDLMKINLRPLSTSNGLTYQMQTRLKRSTDSGIAATGFTYCRVAIF